MDFELSNSFRFLVTNQLVLEIDRAKDDSSVIQTTTNDSEVGILQI